MSCAGFSTIGLIVDLPVEQFRSVLDVCLTGAFIVAKHAGRHLTDGGSLVSISSLNGRQPAIGMSAYCSAKAGLSMLTQVAALELTVAGTLADTIALLKNPRLQLLSKHPVDLRDPAGQVRGKIGVKLPLLRSPSSTASTDGGSEVSASPLTTAPGVPVSRRT